MTALDPDVKTAVVTAYYTNRVGEAEAARTRAQAGYTIASALAAALLAAGAFADLGQRPLSVKILGPLALGVWIVAAALYTHAVAAPVKHDADAQDPRGPEAFVSAALEDADSERSAIDERQNRARVASAVAAVLTAAAILTAVIAGTKPKNAEAALLLSDRGAGSVESICGRDVKLISGSLELSSLDKNFAVIEVDAGTCGDDAATLRVPRRDVLAIGPPQ